MSSRLVNVRLDERRLERVRKLRARGITLSDLVRDAIDRQYEQIVKSGDRRDIDAIMTEIYQRHPDPRGLPPRNYHVHDRRAARKAVLRKLGRKRR